VKAATWLACLFLLGCGDRAPELAPATNRCMQAFVACELGSYCDDDLSICVQQNVVEPYDVVLLITPPATAAGLVAHTSLPKRTVRGTAEIDEPIVVPESHVLRGRVLSPPSDGQPSGRAIDAELAFTPVRQEAYLSTTVSAFTRPISENESGFVAQLEPRTAYQVKVFPLGKDGESLPPAKFTLAPDSAMRDFAYDPLVSFRARLLEETRRSTDAGMRVRLVDKAGEEAVSSVGYTGPDGGVELKVAPSVVERLENYRLVIAARPAPGPWREVITFEGELLSQDVALTVPTVPPPVPFSATVENAGTKLDADVVFTSNFPVVPSATRDSDWCRLRALPSVTPAFKCRADVTLSTTAPGELRAELLPGRYIVYVAPKGEAGARAANAAEVEEILSPIEEPGQAGKSFMVKRAAQFSGNVLSPSGQRMRDVAIRASALKVQRGDEEITRYNRTTETISDKRGNFELAVDTGYYDLIATPSESSGFPTVVQYNRSVEPMASMEPFTINEQIPVILRGTLVTNLSTRLPASKLPLANATVEAYALVPSPIDRNVLRPIRIARTTSSGSGVFALKLPACIDAPCAPSLDASVSGASDQNHDGGVRDAAAPLSGSGPRESGT
jgi:hypothetical protein